MSGSLIIVALVGLLILCLLDDLWQRHERRTLEDDIRWHADQLAKADDDRANLRRRCLCSDNALHDAQRRLRACREQHGPLLGEELQ